MRFVATAVLLGLLLAMPASHAAHAAPPAAVSPSDFQLLPKPGKKVPLGPGHYFVYGFTKPPKIAMCIMKVEIFTKDGKRDTSFVVKGDADMPSMRGAHTMGDKNFSLSKKGDYLLPVPIVMPGDWEVRFTFVKDGRTVLRGIHLFDI